MKPGLLLLNLGTPEAATPEAVGPYLNEFLMDPFVIDIPAPLRWILVKVLIVPRRKHKSAEAYKTIWTTRGSPLLFYLRDLTAAVAHEMGTAWKVEPAMRYGTPAIRPALEKMKSEGVDTLVVLPLYPQYAESSSRSSLEKVTAELADMQWTPKTKMIRSFHDDPGQIDAWVELMKEQMSAAPNAHVLFSYHGLPERHLKKSDPTGTYCLDGGEPTREQSEARVYACCEKALKIKCAANETCYRAQSLETTQLIAEKLGLPRERWSLSFQSRLGRTPWIKPYTDEVIPKLVASGVKSLIVVNPSFVADCLETIEEIGDRAREMFLKAGGEEFMRIECLNARPSWAKAVAEIARSSI
ncbi:ferrochelatase [soil metagenome]